MDDNKFYIGCWSLVTTAVVLIVAVIGFVNLQSKSAVLEMVKAGADPIAAACAVGQLDNMPGVCVGVVVKK